MSVFEIVKKIIIEELYVDETKVIPNASLIDDLGANSLDYIAILTSLETEFDIQISKMDMEKLKTVGDIVKYIEDTLEGNTYAKTPFLQT